MQTLFIEAVKDGMAKKTTKQHTANAMAASNAQDEQQAAVTNVSDYKKAFNAAEIAAAEAVANDATLQRRIAAHVLASIRWQIATHRDAQTKKKLYHLASGVRVSSMCTKKVTIDNGETITAAAPIVDIHRAFVNARSAAAVSMLNERRAAAEARAAEIAAAEAAKRAQLEALGLTAEQIEALKERGLLK